jgi:uncharacterized membrane protein HdeD (DUF308 family)
MLSIYFFVDGLSELFAAFSLQDGKGWLLFDAVVTVLLSIMLFTGFPLAGTVAIGVFLGIKLVFVGVTDVPPLSVAGGSRVRRHCKRPRGQLLCVLRGCHSAQ